MAVFYTVWQFLYTWKKDPLSGGASDIVQQQFHTVYSLKSTTLLTIFLGFSEFFFRTTRIHVVCGRKFTKATATTTMSQINMAGSSWLSNGKVFRKTATGLLWDKFRPLSSHNRFSNPFWSWANDYPLPPSPNYVRNKDLSWYCISKTHHKYLTSVEYKIISKLKENLILNIVYLNCNVLK